MLALSPGASHAQQAASSTDSTERQVGEPVGKWAQTPRFTLGVVGAVSSFTRFLEQRVPAGGQRELTGSTVGSGGINAGVWPFEKTEVRFGVTFAPSTLEFQDDTGTGSQTLDAENLADLNTYVFRIEALQFLAPERGRFVPYFIVGMGGALYDLTSHSPEIVNEVSDSNGTRFKIGTGIGLGAQVRATPHISLQLEGRGWALQNPFDGENSFRVTSGETFDEPSITTFIELSLGLSYSFFGQ